MKLNKLLILVLPFMLAGCSQNESYQQYEAINDQQTIMRDYYRRHLSCQSNLVRYTYNKTTNYNPTYDIFGELAPQTNVKSQYFDQVASSEINVYSGYFISKSSISTYIGNKENVGSSNTKTSKIAFWFDDFEDEESSDGQKELIQRIENTDNDITPFIEDTRTGVAVDEANTSHYFSNNLLIDFKDFFEHHLVQPIATTTRKVDAYRKSEAEIIETANEVIEYGTISNPIHFGEEYKITVYRQITSETTFKYIDRVGWAGTSYKETTSYSLVSDYELQLLSQPRIIMQVSKSVNFVYSPNPQTYTGEALIYQESDGNIIKYWPTLYIFDGENYTIASDGEETYKCDDITFDYKRLHPSFNGYAYHFDNVLIEEDKNYSFACAMDVEAEEPNFETIGFEQITNNANGTIVSANVEGHNLFKTYSHSEEYEFIILVTPLRVKSVIAHLS